MNKILLRPLFALFMATLLLGCDSKDEEPQTPMITKFTPAQGYEGDLITIEGKNFSPLSSENSVKLNGVAATLGSSSTTSISFFVPLNATTGKIEVTVKSVIVSSADDFTVITNTTPKISNMSPANGKTQSTVEFTGQYFTSDTDVISVLFTNASSEPAEIVSANTTSIKVKVPDNALSGPVTLSVRGVAALETPQFDVYENVTDYSPKEGRIGDLITFIGTGFNSNTQLYFVPEETGTTYIISKIISLSNRQIVAAVPPKISSGNIKFGAFQTAIPSAFTFQSSWTAKSNFPGNHHLRTSFSINNKVYFGMDLSTKEFWEFDPQNDGWVQLNDFPVDIGSNYISFSIGSKGYLGLGANGELWEYNTIQDEWTLKSTFPGSFRKYPAFFILNETIWIVGGLLDIVNGTSVYTKETWKYTPGTNTWQQLNDFPNDGAATLGMSIGGKGYVGKIGDPSDPYFYEYNPTLDSWARKKDIPIDPRQSSFAFFGGVPSFEKGNEGFVFYYRESLKYLQDYNEWVNLRYWGSNSTDLSHNINLISGSVVGGKGYYFDSDHNRVVEFTP